MHLHHKLSVFLEERRGKLLQAQQCDQAIYIGTTA